MTKEEKMTAVHSAIDTKHLAIKRYLFHYHSNAKRTKENLSDLEQMLDDSFQSLISRLQEII